MKEFLSFIVFISSIALGLCLWNDSEYTNKAAGILIFAYISFLISNELDKKNED
jgi:hypothetical protein